MRNTNAGMALGVALAACLGFAGMPQARGQDVNVKFDVGPEKTPAEWKPLTVREGERVVTYYCAPNDLLRAVGLTVRDIPDDQNAALVYWQAFDALSASALVGPPMAAHQLAQKAPWSAEDGPEFKALYDWFQSTADARALLRKAAAMKECQFPYLCKGPEEHLYLFGALLPHLSNMRNAARELAVEAHWFEKQGKFREAFDTYFVIMDMARHASGDRFLIGGLVGIACARIAQSNILACLENKALDAETLKWLAQKLEEREQRLPDRAGWVASEKAAALQTVRQYFVLLPNGPEQSSAMNLNRVTRIFYPDRTLTRDFAKYYDWYANLLRQPPWEAEKVLNSGKTWTELAGGKDWNFFAAMLMPALDRAASEYDRAFTWHAALEIDVALRRYRLAHGQYPETLDKLSPEFLKKLPPDPFTGAPFHYRLENGEWLLYSVGMNLQDDGGLAGSEDGHADDIVFRSKR